MTRVDFYVLNDTAPQGRELFACRLIEKAYKLGHRVFVNTADATQTRAMDDLLWTFSQGSFVPHALSTSSDTDSPVRIGHNTPGTQDQQVLVNLAPSIPAFYDQFTRVAEFVDPVEPQRGQARERFRQYRDKGCQVATHDVGK